MVCIIWYLNQFLHIYVCSVHSCVSTCACVHVKASWCWVSSFTDLHLLCWGAGGLPLELREPEGSISLASQLVLGISAPPSDPWNYRWATMAPRLHGCGSVDSRKAAAFPCWAASPPWWCTFLGTMLCFILALPLYVLTPQGSFFFPHACLYFLPVLNSSHPAEHGYLWCGLHFSNTCQSCASFLVPLLLFQKKCCWLWWSSDIFHCF